MRRFRNGGEAEDLLMSRLIGLTLLIVSFVSAPGRSAAQEQVNLIRGLPPDKTWVEYDWKCTRPGASEHTGTLRISSVGAKEIRGQRYRWIEIKLESQGEGETRTRLRKLLVAEQAVDEGLAPSVSVVEGYSSEGTSGPVVRLAQTQINDFLRHFLLWPF
jgi:hypothetical protein